MFVEIWIEIDPDCLDKVQTVPAQNVFIIAARRGPGSAVLLT